MRHSFLKTQGCSIVNAASKEVQLRGVNLGGWLMMEAYFMFAPNTAEQLMKKEFQRMLGRDALENLEKSFRDAFIQQSDLEQIKRWGFNCVRLPFNHRLIDDGKIAYIDRAIEWARSCGIYVILDLHAAYGSQNHDWHSDSLGKAELWTKKSHRHRTYTLWTMLADRYKNEPVVAGYDLLNEPVLSNNVLLNQFYNECIQAIRCVDKKHILFIEGNRYAQEVDILEDFEDDHWAYSIHFYEPLEFTFNTVPHLHYPLNSAGGQWGKANMRKRMDMYYSFAKKHQRPVHVGEFGVNARAGLFGEAQYVHDMIAIFKDMGFHWNYWTYKAIKNHMFPDGIYSYYPNPAWVGRLGPVSGWNTWKKLWPEHHRAMVTSWRTPSFTLNDAILRALKG